MLTTKNKIAEQVLKLLENSNSQKWDASKLPEILKAIEPCLNELLNQEDIDINLPNGDIIPADAKICYFDGLVPEKYNNVSRLLLPVKPLVLPNNLGVFHVSKTNEFENAFIPIGKTQSALIKNENLISDLSGLISYTLNGNYIVFSKDLTFEKDVKLIVGLLLKDISSYDNHTPFPIPDYMEGEVIEACFKVLSSSNQKKEIRKNNIYSKRETEVYNSGTSKLTYLLQLYYEKGCKPLNKQQVEKLAKDRGIPIGPLVNKWMDLKRDNYNHTENTNNIKTFISSYEDLMKIFKDNANSFNDVKNRYDQLKEVYPELTY